MRFLYAIQVIVAAVRLQFLWHVPNVDVPSIFTFIVEERRDSIVRM